MTTLGERNPNLVPLRGGPNENLVSSNSQLSLCHSARQYQPHRLRRLPASLPAAPGQTGRLGGQQSGHWHSGIYEEGISRGTLSNNGRQGLSRSGPKEKSEAVASSASGREAWLTA